MSTSKDRTLRLTPESALKIPSITDERLAELAARIKPVVRNRMGSLTYIKPCGLRDEAFSWSPKITRKASNLVKHATIRTLHAFAYYGFFKPTIAEVLAQIPDELIKQTVAFETLGPADADALNKESAALNAGFHVATTRLYGRAAGGGDDESRRNITARFSKAVDELNSVIAQARQHWPHAEYYLSEGSTLNLMSGPHHAGNSAMAQRQNVLECKTIACIDAGSW